MKVTNSYKVKLLTEHRQVLRRLSRETLSIYRSALSFVIHVCEQEWNDVSNIDGDKAKQMFVERLIHSTNNHKAKYPDFNMKFYKFPSYLRRDVITNAIGVVSSYFSNLENWENSDKTTSKPRLRYNHIKYPTFYRKNMFIEDGTSAKIKLFNGNDWIWFDVAFRQSDYNYFKRFGLIKLSAPLFEMRYGQAYLRFAFTRDVKLVKDAHVIISVDQGITNDAVCVAMCPDGTVLDRKFINFSSEKDHRDTLLNRIKRNQRRGNMKNSRLWRKVKGINQTISSKVSNEIIEYAKNMGAGVIVFEHLNFKDTKKRILGKMKQKIHFWKYRAVVNITTQKAHSSSIRIAKVNAWNTSCLAFDGSGFVKRGKFAGLPYNLCEFSTGKIYNCDLNAAYNIGARYCIRQLLKPLSERTRLGILAKVPRCSKRSTCTLSDLISLNSVLKSFVLSF